MGVSRVPSPGKAGSGQSWKLSVVFPFSVAQVEVLQSELWEGTLKECLFSLEDLPRAHRRVL